MADEEAAAPYPLSPLNLYTRKKSGVAVSWPIGSLTVRSS